MDATLILKQWSSDILNLGSKILEVVSKWVCLSVCLFVCSLTPPKRGTPASWNFEGWFPLNKEGFRLKNIRIRRTVSRKIKKLERVQCALYDLHTLHTSFFPFLSYTPFLAQSVRRRIVNHVEGGSNPGWWYYQFPLQFCSGEATSTRII